jgi:hypothetical protein
MDTPIDIAALRHDYVAHGLAEPISTRTRSSNSPAGLAKPQPQRSAT